MISRPGPAGTPTARVSVRGSSPGVPGTDGNSWRDDDPSCFEAAAPPARVSTNAGLPAAMMIHLASKSPRRRALLDQIGVVCAVVDAPIVETRRADERPERFAERMAREKALAGLAALGDARIAPVLAADTVVALEDRVFGKPRDAAHAMSMLRALSGRMHRVISAVAVAGIHAGNAGAGRTRDVARDTGAATGGGAAGRDADGAGCGRADDEASRTAARTAAGGAPRVATSVSRVWFRDLSHDECRAYCVSGEPLDKAGAYAIQGRAAVFVARLDGSYSGVMGLPLFETAALLREAGIRVWPGEGAPSIPQPDEKGYG